MSPSLCRTIPTVRSLGTGEWNKDKTKTTLLLHSHTTIDCCSTTSTNSTVESEVESYDFSAGWSEEDMAAVADYWKLSDKYQKALYELGYRLRDVPHPKNCAVEVVRFLLAKFGKVEAAETMFRDSLRWREKVGADTIVQHPPPQEIIDNIPGAILKGADRDGDPIFLDRVVSCDSLGLLNKYGTDMMVHHAVWIRESVAQGAWLEEWEKRKGKPVRQVTIVSDMEGLSRRHVHRKVLKLFGEIMRLDQDNYPEGAKRYVVSRLSCIMIVAVHHLVRLTFALFHPCCVTQNHSDSGSRNISIGIFPRSTIL